MRAGISLTLLLRHWLLPAVCLFPAAGCGLRTYTERLERTQRLQDYLEVLDGELVESPWQNDGFRLRVPRQFATAPEETPVTLSRDEAVPGSVRGFVEKQSGVQAVWRGMVRVRGESKRWPAYIVLASNRGLTRGGRHTLKDAMQYEERLIEAMFSACAQTRPLRADWMTRELPADQEFAVTRTYSVFTVPAGPAAAGGASYEMRAYSVNNGEHQFALLFVLPAGVSEDEKLTEEGRIGLCLGTLADLRN
jgi:hypothetical protein